MEALEHVKNKVLRNYLWFWGIIAAFLFLVLLLANVPNLPGGLAENELFTSLALISFLVLILLAICLFLILIFDINRLLSEMSRGSEAWFWQMAVFLIPFGFGIFIPLYLLRQADHVLQGKKPFGKKMTQRLSVWIVIGLMAATLFFIKQCADFTARDWRQPELAKDAHAGVAIGMTGEEVRDLLRGYPTRYLSCHFNNDVSNFSVDDAECFSAISSMPDRQREIITLKVMFIGPGFWHTQFTITFGPDGKVKEISSVEGFE